MTSAEHADLAIVCHAHGYPELAAYHERRARQTRKPTSTEGA